MYPAGHNMTPKRTMLLDFEDTVEYLGLNRADIISPRCDGNETEILLISNSFPLTIPCKTMTIQRLYLPHHHILTKDCRGHDAFQKLQAFLVNLQI